MTRIFTNIYGSEWMQHLPDELLNDLYCAKPIVLDGKIYKVCAGCLKVIHVNKLLVGSLHFC